MDELPNWIDYFGRTLDRALAHGAMLSIILGWVIAIGVTQWIKLFPWYSTNKWAIRALALPIGFIVTYSLWPQAGYGLSAVRVCMALAVGVSAPWVYQGVTRVLYWKWPHLERKFSAELNPRSNQDQV